MQQTKNYNLLIPEGTDVVNPLTQVNPNFQAIDGAMFANKQATIGTASEVVTGTVHAIIRNNADSDVFRFTATGAWTAGDTMTLDGQSVTVHLSDGTTPATNSYIIGAEVLAMVNGSLVTLAISTTPPAQGVTSFNSRTGAVVPTASDYDGSMVDYDNTGSGLNATDVQGAIDELASNPGGSVDYSTTEHVIGTWIDGTTPVYEKTIENASKTVTPSTGRSTCDIPIISGVSKLISIEGYANFRENGSFGTSDHYIGWTGLSASGNCEQAISVYRNSGGDVIVRVQAYAYASFDGARATVTVRYTKSI